MQRTELTEGQWRGERYDGTSSRTGPLRPKKKLKKKI